MTQTSTGLRVQISKRRETANGQCTCQVKDGCGTSRGQRPQAAAPTARFLKRQSGAGAQFSPAWLWFWTGSGQRQVSGTCALFWTPWELCNLPAQLQWKNRLCWPGSGQGRHQPGPGCDFRRVAVVHTGSPAPTTILCPLPRLLPGPFQAQPGLKVTHGCERQTFPVGVVGPHLPPPRWTTHVEPCSPYVSAQFPLRPPFVTLP